MIISRAPNSLHQQLMAVDFESTLPLEVNEFSYGTWSCFPGRKDFKLMGNYQRDRCRAEIGQGQFLIESI